jgi:hypothetical protein
MDNLLWLNRHNEGFEKEFGIHLSVENVKSFCVLIINSMYIKIEK